MQPQHALSPTSATPESSGVPVHVAIIMDGNGRWAKARNLPRAAGHKRGADAVRRVVECAGQMGIGYLTLFGFSSENWRRPESEVRDLMGLLRLYLQNEVTELADKGVRFVVIGDRDRLPKDTVELIESAEQRTASNSRLTLTLALSYGSRQEIAASARALAAECVKGLLAPEQITEDMIEQRLFTRNMPEPDLLIRTSGEQRISNFMLWQLAYTELFFTETLWPDFGQADLEAAVAAYRIRERRFGAVSG